MTQSTAILASPVGTLRATVDERGRLLELGFADESSTKVDKGAARVHAQLKEYFSGKRATFEVELADRGTPFQRRVWAELRKIPFAETISYAELARRIGQPTAVRAVASANRSNPWAIIVPCHRVIGSDGSLTGYAGGIDRKRALLAHERAALAKRVVPVGR